MIRKLHHNAYRCRDSEETRHFYEDFLGLPLVQALDLSETKTGRPTHTLHTFYRLDDGSHMAFFETSDMPFEFKKQHDFDLHIALEVAPDVLPTMLARGRELGIETRDRLDLLSRSQRLRDRAVRQAARARRDDGPSHQRGPRPARSMDPRQGRLTLGSARDHFADTDTLPTMPAW
jgi:catechol 2,3-dioxygenase-like lactoylglutathione lyase family enzyme